MRRFYIEKIPDVGEQGVLAGKEGAHLVNVLRIKQGDVVELLNGTGGKAFAKIYGILLLKRNFEVRYQITEIFNMIRPKPAIALYLACPKGKKFDSLLHQSTELGVWKIQPIITEFSVSHPKISDRHREILITAMKQSGNPYLPELNDAVKFDKFLENAPRPAFFGAVPNSENGADSALNIQKHNYISLWVGPEGGFSTRELSLFLENNFIPISIGNYVLRIETAAIAAISKILAG